MTRPLVALLVLALAGCHRAPPPTIDAQRAAPTATRADVSASRSATPPASSAPPPAVASARPVARPRGSLSGRAVSVEEVDGDIVAVDAGGLRAPVTTTGRDSAPALSPDGTKVAFLRHATTARTDAREVRVVDVKDGEADLLVGAPADAASLDVCVPPFGEPEFSVDAARVFFRVMNGRLGAVCAVDPHTKKVAWILTAVEAELIRKGPYRGHFFAVRRERDVPGPDSTEVENCYVLDSTQGKKVRAVPCGEGGFGDLQDPEARKRIGL